MALDRIEQLIEKYFQGETSIAEEKELQTYFSSPSVAQHLAQYQPIFGYFSQAREQQFEKKIPSLPRFWNKTAWLSIAATVVVLFGVATFIYLDTRQETLASSEYGTYDDPQKALEETQKALALVSSHLNVGIESVTYINEYERSKSKIFK